MEIADAAENQISLRDFNHPHQMGWLTRESGARAVIIDLNQILDRILFETDREKL